MRIICCVALAASFATAQTTPPDLAGVYQVIERSVTLPGGLKNAGSPAELPLLPAAAAQMKSVDLKQDPAKMCVPVGPFRMMAREENKIELVPVKGKIVMLFEDLSRGVMRTIYLNRGHPEKRELTVDGRFRRALGRHYFGGRYRGFQRPHLAQRRRRAA